MYWMKCGKIVADLVLLGNKKVSRDMLRLTFLLNALI